MPKVVGGDRSQTRSPSPERLLELSLCRAPAVAAGPVTVGEQLALFSSCLPPMLRPGADRWGES